MVDGVIEEINNETFTTDLISWPSTDGLEQPPAKVAKTVKTPSCAICFEEFENTKLRLIKLCLVLACNNKFRNIHFKENHGHFKKDDPCECPFCQQSIMGLEKLKYHIKSRHRDGKKKCKDCDMIFRNNDQRYRHWLQVRDHLFVLFL